MRLVAPNDLHAEIDQIIYIKINMDKAMFFNAEDQNYIYRHKQEELLGVK